MILDGGDSVQADHTTMVVVYIQEIKPWPPSHSLRSLPSVFLQWRDSDGSSGHTRHVVPTIGSGVGDGKIKFSESFKASLTASHDRYLEFSLYEPKKDNKTTQDQLIGNVLIDLVKYGEFKKTVSIKAQMSFKRGSRMTAQPVLLIKIHPVNKHGSYSSSKCIQSKGPSLARDGGELAKREYLEETEISSMGEGDVLTHSNLTLSCSSFEATEDLPPDEAASEVVKDRIRHGITPSTQEPQLSKPELKQASITCVHIKESGSSSSLLSSESGASREECIPFTNNHDEIGISHSTKSETLSLPASPTSVAEADVIPKKRRSLDRADLVRQLHEKIVKGRNRYKEYVQQLVEGNNTNMRVDKGSLSETNLQEDENTRAMRAAGSDVIKGVNWQRSDERISSTEVSPTDCEDGVKPQEIGQEEQSKRDLQAEVMHVSAQSVLDPAKGNYSIKNTINKKDLKEMDSLVVSRTGITNFSNSGALNGRKEVKNSSKGKVRQLQYRIEKLERELREVATAEISLYSIVPEHGSSKNKLYAPARRLSRSYFHACSYESAARRASAAKSAVSGLLLVVKACANDVSRLTFWLSNLVALRASISESEENSKQHKPSTRHVEVNGCRKSKVKRSKKLLSPRHMGNLLGVNGNCDDCGDASKFITALKKIEASLFSKITESVWLQVFTPLMQPAAGKTSITNKISRNTVDCKRKHSFGNQEQANFSLEVWKKAFKDALDKLCPVRSEGHECACLSVFTKLVLEQCVGRVDVALFNTLLHESADEIPTNLQSYQVCNSKILPVSAGISSFGSGAQLKNVIVNWSSSLSDIFDISGNKSQADEIKLMGDEKHQSEGSFKFHLLNALSDLMMLPKDALLNMSFRKEVCPTFSALLIKRILKNFVPDEFCPDKIPDAVFTALDMEDAKDDVERIQRIPYNATPMVYVPPSATFISNLLRYTNELWSNQSSMFRKSYVSDDELEEVRSPLDSVIFDDLFVSSARWKPKENGVVSSFRHQLLCEVWKDVDS